MMRTITLILSCLVISSCHKQLDYGIDWNDNDETKQMASNGCWVTVELHENCSYQKAEIEDSEGRFFAYVTRQMSEDVCTVIKYLHNEKGDIRGLIVYPNCYPVPKRTGDALKMGDETDELAEYKKLLWKEYDHDNHPNDIGLALAFDNREDRAYATRFLFKYENNVLVEVYDSIRGVSIKAGEGEQIDYQLMTHELLLTNDSVIGDVLLHFVVRPIEITQDCIIRTYCGYRPMDEMVFEKGQMVRRKIYRSDSPEVYVMVERRDEEGMHMYKLIRNYDDKTIISTYENGIMKKIEEFSRWGTMLQQELYFESKDKTAYICFIKGYDYQKKSLIKIREERIDKKTIYDMSDEQREMFLEPYMFDMWERYTYHVYDWLKLNHTEITIE